jgi:hypothetical protein
MLNQYYKPILTFFIGGIIGIFCILYSQRTTPTQHYPIHVECYWESPGAMHNPEFDVDSIKNDTLWKDGSPIVPINYTVKYIGFN